MKASIKNSLVNAALMAATIALAIVLGSQAPKFYQKWRGNSKTGDFSMHVANQPQKLTLYGTTTCPYCVQAREFLTKAGIPFNDRITDKSKEAATQFASLNEDGVPVLVSGKKLIRGFHADEYRALGTAP